RGGDVLGVGTDWAEEFHLLAFGRSGQGVTEVLRVEHRPAAVSALVERIAGLEADPAQVRVVIETRHGLLVEALVAAGHTVLPGSTRSWSPAGGARPGRRTTRR